MIANSLRLQRELVHRHRLRGRESMDLRSEAWRIARTGPGWPVETVAWALGQAREVAAGRPFGATDLLVMPYAATTALPPGQREPLADLWTWFADRADLLDRLWPGRSPDLARDFERLLPPAPGSADPHRVFSDRCPLAAGLRAGLSLTDPAAVELFGLCRELWERPPADRPEVLKRVRPLLEAGSDKTLRTAVLVALAHQPVDALVWVRGRQERQRVWCVPWTRQILAGALLALAEVPKPWVEPLLTAVGTQAVLFQPARLGRRPPLLTDAVRALLERRTPSAVREADRIYAAYPEELRHWRRMIEQKLRR